MESRYVTECPGCGKRVDRHVAPDNPGATPSKGDVAVCFYCGMICVFDVVSRRKYTLKPIKQDQFDQLDTAAKDSLDRAVTAISKRNQARGIQS